MLMGVMGSVHTSNKVYSNWMDVSQCWRKDRNAADSSVKVEQEGRGVSVKIPTLLQNELQLTGAEPTLQTDQHSWPDRTRLIIQEPDCCWIRWLIRCWNLKLPSDKRQMTETQTADTSEWILHHCHYRLNESLYWSVWSGETTTARINQIS